MARLVLVAGGGALAVAGVAAVGMGIAAPQWLRSLLPPLSVDAAAVGGATVALGCGAMVIGLVQVAVGLMLPRQSRWFVAGAATLSALLGVAWLSIAVVLATESAVGGSVLLILAAAPLLLVAIAYLGAAAAVAMGTS